MATGPGVNQGKTAFLEDFLTGNGDADLDAVNQAWAAAGNDGTISESLFGKVRSRLGLTGRNKANGGATVGVDAGPAAMGKSSPKGAKGKKATEPEEAPPQPGGREVVAGPMKSAFVEEVLGRDPGANVKAINRAWSEAGHDGSISDSIIYKIKRGLGRPGEQLPGESTAPGASEPEASAAGPGIGDGGMAPPSLEGEATSTSAEAGGAAAPAGLVGVVDEVEAGIDELMFTLKANGGMPEVEAALRAARRLLTRSQGGG